MTASRAALLMVKTAKSSIKPILYISPYANTQPIGLPRLDYTVGLTHALFLSCWNCQVEARRGFPFNLVTNRYGLLGPGTTSFRPAVMTRSNAGPLGYLMAPDFSASTSWTSSTIFDARGYTRIGFSFWLYWTTFGNDDGTFADSGSNSGGSGAALRFAPNASSTSKFNFSITNGLGTQSFSCPITRPTAAVWHHYAGNFNLGATAIGDFVDFITIDGQAQAYTSAINAGSLPPPTFAGASQLNFFQRNLDLSGAGRVAYFNLFNRAISFGEAQQLYQHPTLLIRGPLYGYRPSSIRPGL
jgi:hypothetical protein